MPSKLRWPNWPTLRQRYYAHVGIFDKTIHNRNKQIIFYNTYEYGPIQNKETLIHPASKGRLVDNLERSFIQKYIN
jgi:hypothetical protein